MSSDFDEGSKVVLSGKNLWFAAALMTGTAIGGGGVSVFSNGGGEIKELQSVVTQGFSTLNSQVNDVKLSVGKVESAIDRQAERASAIERRLDDHEERLRSCEVHMAGRHR